MAVTYYEKEAADGGAKVYYRHFYRVTENHLPVINLAIVINRNSGDVYLEIEPNGFFKDKEQFSLSWQIIGSEKGGQFGYNGNGPLYNYEFAAEVCKYLNIAFIEMNYCNISLFDRRRAEVFLQTFDDFHKLITGEIHMD